MNARLPEGGREAPSGQELHVSLQIPRVMKCVEPAWCLLHFLRAMGRGKPTQTVLQQDWALWVFLRKVQLAAVKAALWGSGTRQLCWALPQGRNSGMVMLSLTLSSDSWPSAWATLVSLQSICWSFPIMLPCASFIGIRANACYFCRIDWLQAHRFHQGFFYLIGDLLPLVPRAVAVWCQVTIMWDLGLLSVSVAKSEFLLL